MALTPKQKKFVSAYLANGMNATQAAITAGYSEKTAGSQGERLLRNVEIAQTIKGKAEGQCRKLDITAEYVLNTIRESIEKARADEDNAMVFRGAELLGKYLKLFTDKVEASGPNGGPIQTSIAIRFVDADGK